MTDLSHIVVAFITLSAITIALRFMFPAPTPRADTRQRFDSGTTIANKQAIGSVVIDRGTWITVEYRDGRKLNVLPEQVTEVHLK